MRKHILLLLLGAGVLQYTGLQLMRKLGVLDSPGEDVPHRKPVPTIQGVVLYISFILLGLALYPVYFQLDTGNPFLGLLLGGGLVALISLIDELGALYDSRLQLSASVRLLGQIVAALVAFFVSGVGFFEFQVPGGYLVDFGPLSTIVLTVAWFVIFINAINWFDGIYGLASGLSSIGFLTIYLLLVLVVFPSFPDMDVERLLILEGVQYYASILFVVSLVASVIERKPWGVLRDVGTMFLGFALAYLALLGGAKIGMMLVVLALPLFDAIWVIIDRLQRRRKHPFRGDYSHLHYRLLALHWNRHEIRAFIWGCSLCMLVLMLLLDDDRIAKMVVFILMAIIFFGVNRYLYWIKGLPAEYSPSLHRETKAVQDFLSDDLDEKIEVLITQETGGTDNEKKNKKHTKKKIKKSHLIKQEKKDLGSKQEKKKTKKKTKKSKKHKKEKKHKKRAKK